MTCFTVKTSPTGEQNIDNTKKQCSVRSLVLYIFMPNVPNFSLLIRFSIGTNAFCPVWRTKLFKLFVPIFGTRKTPNPSYVRIC